MLDFEQPQNLDLDRCRNRDPHDESCLLFEQIHFMCLNESVLSKSFVFMVVIFFFITNITAVELFADSDEYVFDEIFNEQHVSESALGLHIRGKQMPADERYNLLYKWVIPNEEHHSFRLNFGFTPTYPIPEVSDQFQGVSSGGEFISPALDLIQSADELSRLEELEQRIESLQSSDIETMRSLVALQLLIAIQHGDTQRILEIYGDFLPLTNQNIIAGPSDAEWLVLSQLLKIQEVRTEIGDAIYRYAPWARDWYHPDKARQHWSAMIAKSRQSIIDRIDKDEYRPEVHDLKRWTPVAKENARFNGEGRPPTQWDKHHGYLENLSSYFDDYLFYAIPLTGNFELECEVPPFNWRETSLLVAGKWISPFYNRKEYEIGTFDRDFGNVNLPFTLTIDRDWMRYRVTVRDHVASTYINGEKIHEENLPLNYAPWIAVRSGYRQDGGIRNLRITGDPVVPKEIDLLADPQLASWSPYSQDPFGDQNIKWWISEPRPSEIELRANWRVPRLTLDPAESVNSLKTYQERLLQYCRPILEEGSISYEYYHQKGSYDVFPAIGRLAFLLHEDGVHTHWVSDAKYDRVGTDPANSSFLKENQLVESPLKFNESDWNQVKLVFQDNFLTISLNGEAVYRQAFNHSQAERFGFFHYADQNTVRVRKVKYQGDWEKHLPSVDQQEMAFNELVELEDALENLNQEWDFDFTQRTDWGNKFSLVNGDVQHHFETTDGGLIARRESEDGYRNASISPRLQIQGDFDMTLEYDQIEAETSKGGYNSIFLIARFDTPERDEHFIARRQTDNGLEVKLECHCAIVRRLPDGEFRQHFAIPPCGETSGRLRLVRVGETMYYLTAEADSPFFQLRGQTKIFAGSAPLNEIVLVSQIYKKGRTSVRWKKLTIKAEEITGLATESIAEKLASLNNQRERLPAKFNHDFTAEPPDSNFAIRENVSPWNQDDHGWKITTQGLETWSGPGYYFRHDIIGDFDIVLNFEVLEFPDLSKGGRSAIYLQTQTIDKDRSYLNAIFRKSMNGSTNASGQIRVKRPSGGYDYPSFGQIDLADVSQLRLCRRDDRVYFIVQTKDSDQEVMIGEQEFPAYLIPKDNTRVMVNTGGVGLKTVVLLKSFEVHAESILPGTQ